MKITDISVRRRTRRLVAVEDIKAAEKRLKTTFPQGYEEYATTLGEGVLSALVRVYPPWQVVNGLKDWRRRIRDYWFWGDSEQPIDQEQAQEFVVFADTMNGDEIIFHPDEPSRIFMLPHEDENVYEVGATLSEALTWACTSGVLCSPVSELVFSPNKESSRTELISEAKPQKKSPQKKEDAIPSTSPSRSPEETLLAFWQAFSACEEDPKWKELPWSAYGEAASAILREFCTERIYDGWTPGGRGIPSQYNRQHDETIVDVKKQKSKVFIYTLRPNDSVRKHCWVLLLVDGAWRIDRRKQEGMTFDKYREIAMC